MNTNDKQVAIKTTKETSHQDKKGRIQDRKINEDMIVTIRLPSQFSFHVRLESRRPSPSSCR